MVGGTNGRSRILVVEDQVIVVDDHFLERPFAIDCVIVKGVGHQNVVEALQLLLEDMRIVDVAEGP